MKDLPLSLLSRGCGQFIPSDGRRHGRLDVCFTPEDYYIWKSQNTLLRLSTSGCLLSRQESTLPKTYSTRRGALLLYSQGLVTLKTCPLATSDGKQHFGQYMGSLPVQQMKHQRSISTTLAIMNYTHGQERRYRPPPTILPPLRLPQPPDLKYSETLPSHTQQQHTWEQHVRLKPQSPSVERIKAHQDSPNEENVDGSNRKMRLDVFLQMPTVSRNSSPQIKHHSWDHLEPPNSEKEDLMNAPSTSLEHIGQVQDSEHPQHSDTNFPCISQHRGCDRLPDDEAVSKQLMNRNRHGGQCAFFPPLKDGQAFRSESNQVHTDRLKSGPLSTNEQHIEHLPPIEETRAGVTRHLGNNPQDVKSGKNTNALQQLLFLPRLIPEKFEENGQKKKKEITEKNQEGQSQKVRKGQASEKGCNILLTPGEECPAPVGLLTSVTGKKGPGRQSSMAFLQNRLLNLQHLCEDSSDTNREVVRGLLPLELRDLENGQSVGSLILGPDGEIIHLSVFDHIQDTPQGKALEVLSAEGEKLPWVIMLQPENTHTEEERERDVPLGNTQEHLINKQLLDPQRSAETDPGSVRTSADSDAENYKELKDSRSETKRSKTRKNPKADGVNIGTMSTPDWTQLKRESSQDTGLKDTDKKVSSGRHLSQLPLLEKPVYKADVTQNMSLAEAQIQNTEEERKSCTELQDREETTTTKEKKIKSLRPNSNRQNTLMKRKEGEKSAVHNPQPMSVPKQKEKENTDAADTLSSVTKRFKDTEGRTRVEKMNLDDHFRDEEASVERKKKKKSSRMLKHREIVSDDPFGEEASVERKKKKSSRGMLKHREIISDTDETNSDQEIDEESHQKASTQIDKDHFPTKELTLNTEKPGSSVTSLTSTVNSSGLKQSSSQKSVSSSCESGTLPASAAALSMSRSRLSSCSTVMIPEERLMLNPTKPEVAVTEWTARDREARATTLEAQRAESQRQKEERKRRKQEEEERRQEQREQTEQKMKNELQNERQRRVEELRLKKQAAEEERKNREEEEQKHERQQQELREREIRRQQERRRQMEKFQRKREEEEQRRKAEAEHSRLLEERRLQEENRKLQEMDENERIEYLHKKQKEEDARKREEEEQRRREEEAALLAAEKAKVEEALLAREMALLHQKLSFKRGLILEAEGLEKSQGISRPWTFSYFTLVQLLGLS